MFLPKGGLPYVSFEERGVEKRDPLGVPYVEPVDFVKVTPQGSKDVLEKEVKDWLSQMADRVRMEMENPQTLEHFKSMYKLWKENKEMPLQGTPIKGWVAATFAEQQKCIGLNLRTIEDLATCNMEAVNRLGMGGQALRNRANDWLTAKNDLAPIVMRLETSERNNVSLEARLKEAEDTIRVLKSLKGVAVGEGQVSALAGVPESSSDHYGQKPVVVNQSGPSAGDVIDQALEEEIAVLGDED